MLTTEWASRYTNREAMSLKQRTYKVYMGKLALGIAAVLCLDIAFIAYLYAVKEPGAEIAQKPASNRKPLPPKVPIPTLPERVTVFEETAEPTQQNTAIDRIRPNRKFEREAESNRRPIPVQSSPLRPSFEPKVIAIGRKNKTEKPFSAETKTDLEDAGAVKPADTTLILYRGPDRVESIPAVAAEPVKRSFGSRALRVIKKPWTWTKAAVTRLL